MAGVVRLEDDTTDDSPPVACLSDVSFEAPDARARRRRDLMLDDAVLEVGSIETRRYVGFRVALYYLAALLTGGTVAIVSVWPFARRAFTRWLSVPCDPLVADFALVEAMPAPDGSRAFEVCPLEEVAEEPLEHLLYWEARRKERQGVAHVPAAGRMIVYRHTRFLYRPASRTFQQLLPEEVAPPSLAALRQGLSPDEAAARLRVCGRNSIEAPIPPVPVLLLRECVHPFVVFQVWAVLVWMSEGYYSFSLFILATALATAATNLRDLLKNLRDIARLARFSDRVTVRRADPTPGGPGWREVEVDSTSLVPGDVVRLMRPCRLPADLVLLEGQVTVTEAMLTGEATVVVKQPLPLPTGGEPLPPAQLLARAEGRHTLFGGTQAVELRVPRGASVLAVVVRSGFDTVKGRLVLSILYPPSPPFKFLEQALRYLGLLFGLAMLGFVANAAALLQQGAAWGRIVQRGMDLVTIVVPPALPLALTVGTAFALVTLKKGGVSCISPARVNLAGKVNAFCFDKTGTLTTDTLELSCIRAARGAGVEGLGEAMGLPGAAAGGGGGEGGRGGSGGGPPSFLPDSTHFPGLPTAMRVLLSCCHALTRVGGELAGDPLDLRAFEFTGAALIEPHHHGGHGAGVDGGTHSGGGTGQGAAATGAGDIFVDVRGGGAGATPALPHPAHHAGLAFDDEAFSVILPESATPAPVAAAAPRSTSGAHMSVLRVFEFVPSLQRMGVLARAPCGRLLSLVKGSPEAIAALCDPATLPPDFEAVLAAYTRQGLRVLGAGAKLYEGPLPREGDVPALAAARPLAESSLTFLGLLVMENRLKPASAPTLAALRQQGGLLLAMATGDNAVAAVAVGRHCGLVEEGLRVFLGDLIKVPAAAGGGGAGRGGALDAPQRATPGAPPGPGSTLEELVWRDVDDPSSELDPLTLLPRGTARGSLQAPAPYRLAMTGRALLHLKEAAAAGMLPPELLPRALLNCSIFARMSPEAKAELVAGLQATGLYVGMVGDGANDSQALRAAHVGVSLSPVEASVAAPFTSSTPDISCLLPLLAEGRGALATSFSLFQFMALYSTIQFANALLIVFKQPSSFLSNNMYLYQDLWVVFILSLTLGATPAAQRLTRKRPSGRLFSALNIAITLAFIVTTFLAQGIGFAAVQAQGWYGSEAYPALMDPEADVEGTNSTNPETTTVFLIASFQYLACGAVFSLQGMPWKKGPWANRPFMGWMAVVTASSLILTLIPEASFGVYGWIGLQRLPQEWHWALLFLGLAAAGAYFACMAAVRVAKRAGIIARLDWKAPPKLHKVLRREWAEAFGGALPQQSGTVVLPMLPQPSPGTAAAAGAAAPVGFSIPRRHPADGEREGHAMGLMGAAAGTADAWLTPLAVPSFAESSGGAASPAGSRGTGAGAAGGGGTPPDGPLPGSAFTRRGPGRHPSEGSASDVLAGAGGGSPGRSPLPGPAAVSASQASAAAGGGHAAAVAEPDRPSLAGHGGAAPPAGAGSPDPAAPFVLPRVVARPAAGSTR